jgi:Ni/Co efflux regulator RcnB
MALRIMIGPSLAIALLLLGSAISAAEREERAPAATAAPREERAPAGARSGVRQVEPHPGPSGYKRVTEPEGWNARPRIVDRGSYQHHYQAARTFRIGPYHAPEGWMARRWTYGEILPRAYWAPEYVLADYWLFGLEVPPLGCEWVRDGADAILVNTVDGEILQVEYGVFG